jgi:putative transposase
MRVMEAKLLNGTPEQYQALDEAIRTAQFVRNKCVRYWMDNRGVGQKSTLCPLQRPCQRV